VLLSKTLCVSVPVAEILNAPAESLARVGSPGAVEYVGVEYQGVPQGGPYPDTPPFSQKVTLTTSPEPPDPIPAKMQDSLPFPLLPDPFQ
jgi:hypothetical protein